MKERKDDEINVRFGMKTQVPTTGICSLGMFIYISEAIFLFVKKIPTHQVCLEYLIIHYK